MAEYNPKRSAIWNYGGRNWKLSRSKIDLFTECQRCFYIDNKLGTKRVPLPSFMINMAVDSQLKREFDVHRAQGTKHPLQKEYKINAVPAPHEMIDEWRDNFVGIQYMHRPTKLMVSGAIDDLWINRKKEYMVVDYKATAKNEPVKALRGKWHEAYKRQIEVYQWLLRQKGLNVSNTSYFVYCTGKYDQKAFDKKIEFDVVVFPYTGNDAWVEPVLHEIKSCLESDAIPKAGEGCEHCAWWYTRQAYENTVSTQSSVHAPRLL